MRSIRTAVVLLTGLAGTAAMAAGQSVPSQPITQAARDAPTLQLTQVVRLGNLDGEHDAFGRVMDVALDRAGRILVADDLSHHVVVFARDGRYVGTIGRRGAGPGEFESPWEVATDARDSIFVWDMGQARISVFGPDLSYRRSFRVPPQWSVGSISFLADGRLLLAAYGPGERGTLHVLDREVRLQRTFGPGFSAPDLAGFEASLLGGTAAIMESGIVYSTKSPYELWFFGPDGTPRRRCVGRSDWTTAPASVVERREGAAALHWRRYVHSYSVVPLGGGLVLNQVLDPAGDRTVMDVVSQDCTLVRRTTTAAPLMVTDASGSRLAAVRSLEYPEVIIYEQRVRR
jgi:hypothetical protein